jgi:hypothetical protein
MRGKYSIVPYPACVGRLDRELPGWAPEEVEASIRLVRERMTPNWDIHPEMVTHTRVIDLHTGHPYPARGLNYMENWDWTVGKSVDEISEYIAYALRILHNVDLPCEGITTPGSFGNGALPELSQAVFQACRDVYRAEIPHCDEITEGDRSVAPRVEFASDIGGSDPRCVVSIVCCTGDWTGNWDATQEPQPDRFISADLSKGRVVDVLSRGEPACMLAHWTGIHHNGTEKGFRALQEVVRRLHSRYNNLVWMKLSELSRYWAAKELTRTQVNGARVVFDAPFACPAFTMRVAGVKPGLVTLWRDGRASELRRVSAPLQLESGTWAEGGTICFDLPRGRSEVVFG